MKNNFNYMSEKEFTDMSGYEQLAYINWLEDNLHSIKYKFDAYIDYTTNGRCSKSYYNIDELKCAFNRSCESCMEQM